MKIVWTPHSIPAYRLMDGRDRRRLNRQCGFKAMRHWQLWAAIVLCAVVATAVRHFFGALAGVISMGLGGGVIAIVAGHLSRRYFIHALCEVHCPRCDYDMRGNATDTCPECGGYVPSRHLPKA